MAHVNPIQVQKYLKGVDYPAKKDDLLAQAQSLGADDNVRQTLERLPDEEFQTPAEVSQAIGDLEEGPGEPGRKAQAKEGKQEKQEKQEKPRHTGTNEFLVEAMQDTRAEIKTCQLALKKSENEDVKAFAQMMLDEHGKFGHELEQLAKKKGLDVPRDIRREQKMTVDELSGTDGGVFEQRWIQYNIDVHERDVKVFRHYSEAEGDSDIKALAKRASEMMSQHLKMAHDLGKKLAKAKA